MSDIVIRVENLSKLYRLGELHKQTGSFRDTVTQSFRHALSVLRRAPSNSPNPMLFAPCPMPFAL